MDSKKLADGIKKIRRRLTTTNSAEYVRKGVIELLDLFLSEMGDTDIQDELQHTRNDANRYLPSNVVIQHTSSHDTRMPPVKIITASEKKKSDPQVVQKEGNDVFLTPPNSRYVPEGGNEASSAVPVETLPVQIVNDKRDLKDVLEGRRAPDEIVSPSRQRG